MKNVMFLKIKWKGALYSNGIERVELEWEWKSRN